MIFDDFEIHAEPFITKAYCRECHNYCQPVSNGWLSKALFCPKCEIVYQIKMVKAPKSKVDEDFIKQARAECSRVK